MKINDRRFKSITNDFQRIIKVDDIVGVEFEGKWTSKGFIRNIKDLKITRFVDSDNFFAEDKNGKETLISFSWHREDDDTFSLVPQTAKSKSFNNSMMSMIKRSEQL